MGDPFPDGANTVPNPLAGIPFFPPMPGASRFPPLRLSAERRAPRAPGPSLSVRIAVAPTVEALDALAKEADAMAQASPKSRREWARALEARRRAVAMAAVLEDEPDVHEELPW